jgi:hypothetical protein
MERFGGRIEVSSTPGRGTMFSLRFEAASSGSPPTTPPSISAIPTHRILLIDDDPDVRQSLAILAAHLVDIVLADLAMPVMNGWDVARHVNERFPLVPVIVLTGWDDGPPTERAQAPLVKKVLSEAGPAARPGAGDQRGEPDPRVLSWRVTGPWFSRCPRT